MEASRIGVITSGGGELIRKKLEKQRFAIRRQFDYYFGDTNYPKDTFLRAQGDACGWTNLSFVSKFNRVKELTQDLELIRACLAASDVVEVSTCGNWVRRRAWERD